MNNCGQPLTEDKFEKRIDRLISSLVRLTHNCPEASADPNHYSVLLQICDIDTITPTSAAEETETRLGKADTLNGAADLQRYAFNWHLNNGLGPL